MLNTFQNVAVRGITVSVPSHHIDIDEEIAFFENNPKKLARAKKIIGFGTRHVVEKGVTALDLCEHASKALLKGMNINKTSIDGLILVNQ
ncbi:MAG: hypothetical protein IJS50_01200, partial [Desulfovibrio sp.]|nr:hypothetical protein [Desulfovibrio sp.]